MMKSDPVNSNETTLVSQYSNWIGYPLLCENLTARTVFQGSDNTFNSSLAQFELHKCRNEDLQPDEPRCADPADIDKFVERLYFDQYANMEKIDFEKHFDAVKRPTRRIDKYMAGGILRPDRVQQNWYYARLNMIEMEVDAFQFGQLARDESFYDFSEDTIELQIFAPSDNKNVIL